MQRNQLLNALKKNFVTKIPSLGSRTITDRDSIHSLGGNSLVLSEAVSQTIRQLGLKIGRDELLRVRNVGDLLNLMEKAGSR